MRDRDESQCESNTTRKAKGLKAKNINTFVKELGIEILDVSLTLFKIIIPIIFLVKVIDELGGTVYLGKIFEPLMQLVGLPEFLGIVWATTILTNIYAGVVVFFSLIGDETLSIAQVSVLGCLMLVAHALPIEGSIAKKSGVNYWVTILVRIGGAILLGWLMHSIYSYGNWLQEPVEINWRPESLTDNNIRNWLIEQGKSLLAIQLIIIVLLTFLKTLKALGIEKLMIFLLRPILKILGISEKASTLTVVGMMLGLTYGGGLLINEARKGHISARDVCASIIMLSLLHSIIEDTLLILLLGADITAILWGRIIFTFIVVAAATRVMSHLGEPFCRKYIYKPVNN